MVMSFQMKMTAVLSGLLFTVTPIAVDANEDKLTKGYYTFDSMGCMLLRECTDCLLYTSPSPRDRTRSRMPSSA